MTTWRRCTRIWPRRCSEKSNEDDGKKNNSTLIGLLALLWTACGGSSHPLTIAMQDMHFRDAEVHVQAGQPVTLHVVNRDGYAHAFDIDAFDIHTPLPAKTGFDAALTPTEPGRYRFYCSSPGHEAAGMEGVLVVEP